MELDNIFLNGIPARSPERKIKPKVTFLKWMHNNQQIVKPSGIGFIYLITEISTGKIYVGKKYFYKKDGSESDWKNYTTSSIIVSKKIKCNPSDFKAEILEFCNTAKELSTREKYHIKQYKSLNNEIGFNKR